jgi:hypothetical protein
MKPAALVIAMLLSAGAAARPATACGYRRPAWEAAMFVFFESAALPEGRVHRVHFLDHERGVAAIEIRWTPAGATSAKARLVFLRRGAQPAHLGEAVWTVAELGMAWVPDAGDTAIARRS